MNRILIKNAKCRGEKNRCDILIEDGRFKEVKKSIAINQQTQNINTQVIDVTEIGRAHV